MHQRADLLLLDADPLADVANVRLLAGVSLRGTWLSADAIDAMLEEIEALAQLLNELEPLLLAGEISEALQAYQNAQERGASIPARAWNWLCWYGSLWGHAAEVMAACEQAVALAPDLENIRDSRGLARALTGDVAGAIDDFEAFVAWTTSDRRRAQRQGWIDALRAGQNPFTPELLERLRN